MSKIAQSDLIINSDASIYHLNLFPEDVGDIIITVGDQDRVAEVSKHFDSIDIKKGKREFITHTGFLNKKRISVVSTGIGTDNIDIVLNELDALVNIDFDLRHINSQLKSLKIIRLGTSGSIQEDIEVGSILASSHGLGLDSLMNYYDRDYSIEEKYLEQAITKHIDQPAINPYLTAASSTLLTQLAYDLPKGITVTAPGFYAPQGRQVRAKNAIPNLLDKLSSFNLHHLKITNLEMETAGIYALANVLGHEAISINAILANRLKFEFAKNPQEIIDKMIISILEKI